MKKVLFTRKITEQQRNYAKLRQIEIIEIPFIKIKKNNLSIQQLCIIKDKKWTNWIFTSQNAVKFFPFTFQSSLNKQIYCVGKKTFNRLKIVGFKNIHKAKSVNDLIKIFTPKAISNILYFCGDRRQNIIKNYCTTANINYYEVFLYSTIFLPKSIDLVDYKAVCFCSPSSVNCFLSSNPVPEIPILAIGKTTAEEIQKYTKCFIANSSTIESIIDKAESVLN